MTPRLFAATATPLTPGGDGVDEQAIAPLARFVLDGGADGNFICGTTGEGFLLSTAERFRVAECFRAAAEGILIVHCGAQSTAETVALAAHSAKIGADGVAVIPPPYFPWTTTPSSNTSWPPRRRARRCRSTCTPSRSAVATR